MILFYFNHQVNLGHICTELNVLQIIIEYLLSSRLIKTILNGNLKINKEHLITQTLFGAEEKEMIALGIQLAIIGQINKILSSNQLYLVPSVFLGMYQLNSPGHY